MAGFRFCCNLEIAGPPPLRRGVGPRTLSDRMNRKVIIGRLIIEILILVVVFSAVDQLTWPEDTTAAAVRDAVNKKQLEPVCMVEVISAIHSASFMRVPLFVIQAAAIFLLGSDLWLLWHSRRRRNQPL